MIKLQKSSAGTMQLEMGSAPASGAVRRASRLTLALEIVPPLSASGRRKCSARGVPNCSRGGCNQMLAPARKPDELIGAWTLELPWNLELGTWNFSLEF
jgi:hypothetical protein